MRAASLFVFREDIRAERTRFTTLQRQMQLQQLHAQLRARQEQQRGQKAVYEVVQKGEFRPPAEKEASTEGLATEGFGAVPLSVPVASADGKDGEPATWGAPFSPLLFPGPRVCFFGFSTSSPLRKASSGPRRVSVCWFPAQALCSARLSCCM